MLVVFFIEQSPSIQIEIGRREIRLFECQKTILFNNIVDYAKTFKLNFENE